MSARFALIDSDGMVLNIIIWDNKTPYATPFKLVPTDDNPNAQIGGKWDANGFIAPNQTEPKE